jgi:plasmid stabilization system protein ParE
MELKIYWTSFAKSELQNIFEYYREYASIRVAKKLTAGIALETKKLKKQPEIGQIEDFLDGFAFQYRYLVYKNYKIVYYIDNARRVIEIHDVFDTRQNPIKISRKK